MPKIPEQGCFYLFLTNMLGVSDHGEKVHLIKSFVLPFLSLFNSMLNIVYICNAGLRLRVLRQN